MAVDFATSRAKVEGIIDYTFKDSDLLKEAFWAAGPTTIGTREVSDSNLRLALLGDAVMRMLLIDIAYDMFHYTKGHMQNACEALLSNKTLNGVGRKWKLDECVVIDRSTGTVSNYKMASAVEAIFGALWLDCGRDAVVMMNAFERMVLQPWAADDEASGS